MADKAGKGRPAAGSAADPGAASGMTREALLASLEAQGVGHAVVEGLRTFAAAHPAPDAVSARIPRPSIAYLGKDVWEEAACALLAGQNVLLAGPKATGKNVLAENLACALGRPLWNVSLHIDADASTLIGTDTYAEGRVSFRPGPIAQAAELGGLCVLDEANMARSEALAVLHAALDFRRVIDVPGYNLVRLHEACRFVGTMNVGYAGTRELNEALTSRFAVISMPTLDVDDVERLLRAQFADLAPRAAKQLALLFDEIRLKCEHGELSERALDLRGMMSAVNLARAGLDLRRALEICVVNKTFDAYERQLVRDVIDARLPKALKSGLFA